MNAFINTKTNQYPYWLGDLLSDNPWYNVYQPLPDGVLPVVWVEAPDSPDAAHYYLPQPVEINGVWTVQWTIHDFTEEELQAQKDNLVANGGPGYLFDKESQTWYPSNPLVRRF